jgi:hypothetical protein
MLPVNTKRLKMLSRLSLLAKDPSGTFWFFEFLKNKVMTAIVNPPSGRFIQKLSLPETCQKVGSKEER